MPCRSYEDDNPHEYYQPKLDMLARYLCACCNTLENNNIEIPKKVRAWWSEHKEKDRQRIKEEEQNKLDSKVINEFKNSNPTVVAALKRKGISL